MTNDVILKVLWIDDEEKIVKSTKQDADEYGIMLDHYSNWQEAEKALKNNFEDYSAIIFDAFCQIRPNEDIKEEFITTVLPSLTGLFGEKKKYIPWFILSAGTMTNFSFIVKSATEHHLSSEWGQMVYIKDRPDDDPQNSRFLFENIREVGEKQSNNIVLFRYRDVFRYLGEGKLIDNEARKEMLKMLSALYYPENHTGYTYEGNPLRKVMEYVFRAANKMGLLPQECFERDNQLNLLESNRYMSGMNTKHSHLRYGEAGPESDGSGGQTIFPKYMGHMTRAIIEFGSIDSHTNEAYPYTIDDANLTLTEDEKELFFSYVLQLCHVIKFFGQFVDKNPDVAKNKAMKKVLSTIAASAADYEGFKGEIKQDSKGNCYCDKCILSFNAAQKNVGKRVELYDVTENEKSTKVLYPLWAKFRLLE